MKIRYSRTGFFFFYTGMKIVNKTVLFCKTESMKRILIIEDDELLSKMMFDRLTACTGFVVERALTGGEGLRKLHECVPDFLLLDLELPDVHGFDILQHAVQTWSGMTAIIVTINASTENRRIAETLGARLFLEKPFDLDMLINYINSQNN